MSDDIAREYLERSKSDMTGALLAMAATIGDARARVEDPRFRIQCSSVALILIEKDLRMPQNEEA